MGKHQYLEDMQLIMADDAVAYERNMKKLSTELSKARPDPEILENLMAQTYANRRASVVGGELGLLDVYEKFPLLRKPKYVSQKDIWDFIVTCLFLLD